MIRVWQWQAVGATTTRLVGCFICTGYVSHLFLAVSFEVMQVERYMFLRAVSIFQFSRCSAQKAAPLAIVFIFCCFLFHSFGQPGRADLAAPPACLRLAGLDQPGSRWMGVFFWGWDSTLSLLPLNRFDRMGWEVLPTCMCIM